MCEHIVATDIYCELDAAQVSYQTIDSRGVLAHIDGKRGDNSRCVVLYADEYYWDKVLQLTTSLASDADFEGRLYIFFPAETFVGELEPSLFDSRKVVAAVMPTENFSLGQGEVLFCPGKMLASRDVLRVKITPEQVGAAAITNNHVVSALSELALRVENFCGEDCRVQINDVVAKAELYPVPHCASFRATIYCLKEGVRESVRRMILGAVDELEYKYDVAVEAAVSPCEPCVENDLQLSYEAMLQAREAGYMVHDGDAEFTSHPFGYVAECYPSLMYYCGVSEHTDCRELAATIVKNILNK